MSKISISPKIKLCIMTYMKNAKIVNFNFYLNMRIL